MALDCTPELRHAGRRLIRGHLGRFVFIYISLSSRRAAGVWNIPKGFPRPVGAVVNRSLVFHRFHQCRHCVPCMFDSCWGASPLSNLMEVKD